jgi:glycosyltransferase involved in cell wall biosynthesis
MEKGKISRSIYTNILLQESTLYKKFDKIWACSDIDAKQFHALNEGKIKIDVVPNGAEIRALNFKENTQRNRLLFCGSLDYAPNEEGLMWFVTKIWPLLLNKCKEIYLTIIGRGNLSEDLKEIFRLSKVNYQGEVEDVLPFYSETDVVVVPLLSGSGTRLKVLEAMAYGRPIVSTSKGAEGINYENRKHLIVEDDPDLFAKRIIELFNDDNLYSETSNNAKVLIEGHYSWDKIGEIIKKSILYGSETDGQRIDNDI